MVTTLCGSKSMTLATPMLRSLLWFRSAKVETGLRTGTRGSRDQSFIFRLFFSQLGKRPGAGTGNGALMAFAIATQVVIHAIADASALKSAQQKFANLRVPHAEFHLIDVPHPTPPPRSACARLQSHVSLPHAGATSIPGHAIEQDCARAGCRVSSRASGAGCAEGARAVEWRHGRLPRSA